MQSKNLKIRPQYAFLGKGVLLFAALVLLRLVFSVYVNSQKENIAQAILLENFRTVSGATAFVSIDGDDPSGAFIRNLKRRGITVLKPSQGVAENDQFSDSWGDYYKDKATRQKGRLVQIGEPSWIIPIFVWVEVNYPGNGERFSLRKNLRGWSVTHKEMSWIE